MTSTWIIDRKGKSARISFVDEAVYVVIDGVQFRIANPNRRGGGRRKYWPCESHCVRLLDRAVTKIEEWKREREERELARMKEHVYA
jgi:hypothetical protein